MTDVEQIFSIIDQLNDVEIEFQSGDVKLWVKKARPDHQAGFSPKTSEAAVTTGSKPAEVPTPPLSANTVKPAASGKALSQIPTGAVEIKAPMLGRFFSAPSPTDPPYVTLGNHVREGDTIALLEVMKLFNTVTAELSGKVIEIRVKNGDMVEFGQTLFVIQPD